MEFSYITKISLGLVYSDICSLTLELARYEALLNANVKF